MAYTELKLNYLLETKSLIREAAVAKGAEISESDTFRSYAEKIAAINGDYSDVHFVTFMSEDGSTELYKRPVADGDDCADPVDRGLIEEPTKESTAQYNYTHVGWSATPNGALNSNVLKAVTADKNVYANFAAVLRYYTVNFYDGETLLKSESIAYGGSSSYTYEKENHVFNGWNPSPTNITGNMDCYGEWEESYAFADASWEYIAEKAESGQAEKYFNLGDTKTIRMEWLNSVFTDLEIQIIGFNHDDLADGSGKAGITIATKNSVYIPAFTNNIAFDHVNGWESARARTEFNSTSFNNLPQDLRQCIKDVIKQSRSSSSNASIVNTIDKLFIPSATEYAGATTYGEEGTQYEYYKTTANRKKYRQDRSDITSSYDKHGSRTRGNSANFSSYIDASGALQKSAQCTTYCSIAFCV